MIGYKAFDKDLRCRGFQFEVGKKYSTQKTIEELSLCSDTVFNFCRELQKIESTSDYRLYTARICEVIATGDIIEDGFKFGTNEILILRELSQEEKERYYNINAGNYNTGEFNTGECNTGNENTGDSNTGCNNTGGQNTGNNNVGYWNSGHLNIGCWNTGRWNLGDHHTGFFNTKSQTIYMFNKHTELNHGDIVFPSFLFFDLTIWVSHDTATEAEKEKYKWEIKNTGGFLKKIEYKDAFRQAYDSASQEEHIQLFSLPNFDPAIFQEISGIDATEEYMQWKRTTIKETKDGI